MGGGAHLRSTKPNRGRITVATVTIRLLESLAGPDHSHSVGEELTVDAVEAKRFLEAGIAEPVSKRTADKAEKRVVSTTEDR